MITALRWEQRLAPYKDWLLGVYLTVLLGLNRRVALVLWLVYLSLLWYMAWAGCGRGVGGPLISSSYRSIIHQYHHSTTPPLDVTDPTPTPSLSS